jgi:hypothetical protein
MLQVIGRLGFWEILLVEVTQSGAVVDPPGDKSARPRSIGQRVHLEDHPTDKKQGLSYSTLGHYDGASVFPICLSRYGYIKARFVPGIRLFFQLAYPIISTFEYI